MDRAVILLSVLSVAASSQSIIDQRRFSIAVSRVQHIHLLAQKYFSDFVIDPCDPIFILKDHTKLSSVTFTTLVNICKGLLVKLTIEKKKYAGGHSCQMYLGKRGENSLQTEDQRQLNKIFLQDFCNSDDIISPIDKHETQRSSVLKLLSISIRLVESWEFSSRFITWNLFPRNQISHKLSELKTGIRMLIEANQDGAEVFSDSSTFQVAPYGNFYQSLGGDESLRRNYELLACFKKDMHKVETYLTVAKCRLSPEANCTL